MRLHSRPAVIRTCIVTIIAASPSLGSIAPAAAAVTEPTPGASEYQPWPTARPGRDQQATEQQNFNTYYSTPMYNATDPSADQRNADAYEYLLEINGDLSNIHPGLWTVALTPYASDVTNLAHQLPYLLGASGPNIAPMSAADARNADEADRWLQSMDLSVEGIANPDPATRLAIRQLEDEVLPNSLEEHYYAVYLSEGYPAAESAALSKQHIAAAMTRPGYLPAFSATEVAQLRNWYYKGVTYIDSDGKEQSTWLNFKRVREYAGQTLRARPGIRFSATVIRTAVIGAGAYAPGKIDFNGFTYPETTTTPIPNQCPTGYICPPLADPPG
jgi:hypothetical protein